MNQQRTEQAAYNNAMWCDTVCRAHGKGGEFMESIWINRYDTPRFYPNVVTLKKADFSDTQIACINELVEANISGKWAIKDSFCALDLTPLRFRMVLEAQWIYRGAFLPRPELNVASLDFRKVDNVPELAAWEAAWRGKSLDEVQTKPPRIFMPSLLEDENLAFIAVYQSQQIVAGAIGNRTGTVVGLSNVFVMPHNVKYFWASCIAGIMKAFPGLPLVGYEYGDDLSKAQAMGFEVIAPLRIWMMDE